MTERYQMTNRRNSARPQPRVVTLILTLALLLPTLAFGNPPMMTVEVTKVSVGAGQEKIPAKGTLFSNESVNISPEIAGRIETISTAEGREVTKGDVLVQLDASILKAEVDQAEANLALHRANYQRAEALYKDHAISERERDEAFAEWKLDRAALRLNKAQLEKTTIRAPFSGTLGLRQASPGDYVSAGQVLFNLEDIRMIKVEFKVAAVHASRVRVGQSFSLRNDAYPQISFQGEIYAINPKVEESSRTLVVRGILDNKEKLLAPGQFAKISLLVGEKEEALYVPEQAIVPKPKKHLVMKVVDGKIAATQVKLGKRLTGWVEVVEGLAPGDVVVTGGLQKIGDGMPVKTVPANPALFTAKAPGK